MGTRTFLVGERLSVADIAVACTLLSLYKQVLDPAFRKPFMNVTRWFTTVVNQPHAKDVLGAVPLASKMAEFDAKKFAEFSGKGGDNKKAEKKEKAPKQEKKPEKKKEEKKKEEEAEVPDFPAEPKKKDPMDALPKGSFDLEEEDKEHEKKPDWVLGEKEGKSKSTSEAPPEGLEDVPMVDEVIA